MLASTRVCIAQKSTTGTHFHPAVVSSLDRVTCSFYQSRSLHVMLNYLSLRGRPSRTPRSPTSPVLVPSSPSSTPPPPYTPGIISRALVIPVEVRELECVLTLRKLLEACDRYRQGNTDFWFAPLELSVKSNLILFAHCRRTDNNQKNLDLYNTVLDAVLQLLQEIDELGQWNNRSVKSGVQDIADGLSSFERAVHFSMPNYRDPDAPKDFRFLDQYPLKDKLQRSLMKALGSRNMTHSRLFPTNGPSAYVEATGGSIECSGTAFTGNTGSFEVDFTAARITCNDGSLGSNNQFGMGANSVRVCAVDADIVTGGDSFCNNENLGNIDLRGATIRCTGSAFTGNRGLPISSDSLSTHQTGSNERPNWDSNMPAGPRYTWAVSNPSIPSTHSSAAQVSSPVSPVEGPSFASPRPRTRTLAESPYASRRLSTNPPTRLANISVPASRRASLRYAESPIEPAYHQAETAGIDAASLTIKTIPRGSLEKVAVRKEHSKNPWK